MNNMSDRFYIVSEKGARGALNLVPKHNLDFDKLFRGKSKYEEPIEFMLNYGTRAYDFINSGYAGVYLISNKVVDLLTKNNVSGCGFIPARIQGHEKHDFSLLTVNSSCGEIDYSKSLTFLKEPFTPTGRPIEAKKGLFFDTNTWDKSDIFSPRGSRFTFITEKVMKLLKANKATNVDFKLATDFELI